MATKRSDRTANRLLDSHHVAEPDADGFGDGVCAECGFAIAMRDGKLVHDTDVGPAQVGDWIEHNDPGRHAQPEAQDEQEPKPDLDELLERAHAAGYRLGKLAADRSESRRATRQLVAALAVLVTLVAAAAWVADRFEPQLGGKCGRVTQQLAELADQMTQNGTQPDELQQFEVARRNWHRLCKVPEVGG